MLKDCFSYLEEGGWFLLEVPSDLSAGGATRLSHTFVFNGPVLAAILQRAGFKMVTIAMTPHWMILCQKP
jgi:hypothetical protein